MNVMGNLVGILLDPLVVVDMIARCRIRSARRHFGGTTPLRCALSFDDVPVRRCVTPAAGSNSRPRRPGGEFRRAVAVPFGTMLVAFAAPFAARGVDGHVRCPRLGRRP
jgi:hypothetical protein